MNSEELDLLRKNNRLAIFEGMNAWQTSELSRLLAVLPPERRTQWQTAAKNTFRKMRERYLQMTFPGLPPEQSDLWAAEFQEAFDTITKNMEEALGIEP